MCRRLCRGPPAEGRLSIPGCQELPRDWTVCRGLSRAVCRGLGRGSAEFCLSMPRCEELWRGPWLSMPGPGCQELPRTGTVCRRLCRGPPAEGCLSIPGRQELPRAWPVGRGLSAQGFLSWGTCLQSQVFQCLNGSSQAVLHQNPKLPLQALWSLPQGSDPPLNPTGHQ